MSTLLLPPRLHLKTLDLLIILAHYYSTIICLTDLILWSFGFLNSCFLRVMLTQASEPKPRRSSRESPFHSNLQPSCSRASSWKPLTLAHLPVHPPTPSTRTQWSYPRNTQRKLKNLTTPFFTLCQPQPPWKRLILPQQVSSLIIRKSASEPLCSIRHFLPGASVTSLLPQWQARSLQQIQSGF
ncbi:hypothetical protein AMECASPLE_033298 [Ameca splendens]|uniref:Uncharacterized protein n=1 Tax=Ameca splendens TaxID=208324 RepID=A0ABV0Z541_9TELE